MKKTKLLVLFLLFLNTSQSIVFGQQPRISINYPSATNHSVSELRKMTITRVSIWEKMMYIYFDYITSPNLENETISLSSYTSLDAINTNTFLEIKE